MSSKILFKNVALPAVTVVTVNRTKDGGCLDIAQNATNMDYELMYLTNLGAYDFCNVENTDRVTESRHKNGIYNMENRKLLTC